MRRQLVSLTFATMAMLPPATAAAPAADPEPAGTTATVAVQRATLSSPYLREEAAMVLVGTALIALAAAVRRAAPVGDR